MRTGTFYLEPFHFPRVFGMEGSDVVIAQIQKGKIRVINSVERIDFVSFEL